MKDPLYLVTGAAGHLGSTVIKKLLEKNARVRAFILPSDQTDMDTRVEIIRGDITNPDDIKKFLYNPENENLVVIHCAGIVSIKSKFDQKVYDVNVGGTKKIVDASLIAGVKTFLYVSSVHAIPEKPKGETMTEITHFDQKQVVGLYAETKAEATAYVLDAFNKGLDARIVHPSGIIGPYNKGDNHTVAMLIDYLQGRLTSAIAGGYDFVDVRDVAIGILECLEKGRPGQTYILTGGYYRLTYILDIASRITGKKPIRNILPLWFVKFLAPVEELYYRILRRPPLFTTYSIYTVSSNARFSHEKATKELGYNPRPIKETIKDTISYLELEDIIKPKH